MTPPVNIIEADASKSSVYVTMSYYIILIIVLINTMTFSFYFCILPLNKYCKDNEFFKDKEFNMGYNGYSKKSSKDIIIESTIDSIDDIDDVDADDDTDDRDVLSSSDATEEEQEWIKW